MNWLEMGFNEKPAGICDTCGRGFFRWEVHYHWVYIFYKPGDKKNYEIGHSAARSRSAAREEFNKNHPGYRMIHMTMVRKHKKSRMGWLSGCKRWRS